MRGADSEPPLALQPIAMLALAHPRPQAAAAAATDDGLRSRCLDATRLYAALEALGAQALSKPACGDLEQPAVSVVEEVVFPWADELRCGLHELVSE